MNCKSCGKPFTCGCQKTKASDGSTVHKTCLTQYNGTLAPTKSNDQLTSKIQRANQNLNR